jgi:antitoxin component HigA of HigAB toxin-antitoxin module
VKIDQAIELAAGLAAGIEAEMARSLRLEQAVRLKALHGEASALHKFLAGRRRASWGPGPDALRALMLEHGLTGKDLSRETGIRRTTLSSFLTRRRGLSNGDRSKLSKRFGIEPTAFL